MPLAQQALDAMRCAAEASLFYYARTVWGLRWLSPDLHKDMASFLQSPSKPRKLMLVPRDHVKTTLVKILTTHMMIQPASQNIYFPGVAGTDTRMIIAGETTKNAARHLRNIESFLEKNQLFKLLWPHIKPGAKCSEHELEVVRSANYSEPTIEALGTDTAIASRHVDAIFCDDIYTFEAMQSPSVSERVNLWFEALEPILDETENTSAKLFVTGTPWAEKDVYKSKIIDVVEQEGPEQTEWAIYHRSVIENGQPIWPERFSLERLARIEARTRLSGLWMLNWMCAYGESEFNDFRSSWLKEFTLEGGIICLSDGRKVPLSICDIVMAYDPARTRESEYKHLARNAVMVTACDPDYNVYLLAYYAKRESFKNVYDDGIKAQALEFRPRCLGVEDVATQIAIGDAIDIISDLQGDDLPPIVSLHPDTSVNKKWRIKTQFQRLAPYGKFFIQKHHYEFRSEWSAFPNGRTIDILDVGAYCIGLHNIPSELGAVDRNKILKERMAASRGDSNVIDIDDRRYEVRRPPEDLKRALMRMA